jgi:hypothetical protein
LTNRIAKLQQEFAQMTALINEHMRLTITPQPETAKPPGIVSALALGQDGMLAEWPELPPSLGWLEDLDCTNERTAKYERIRRKLETKHGKKGNPL